MYAAPRHREHLDVHDEDAEQREAAQHVERMDALAVDDGIGQRYWRDPRFAHAFLAPGE
jgi:hypothetical protein